MSADRSACARATAAAMEVVKENCEGVNGTIEELAPDVFAFVPEKHHADVGLDEPLDPNDDQLEGAIESCMDSEWARDWAESVLGPDATDAELERARRRACEGLFD